MADEKKPSLDRKNLEYIDIVNYVRHRLKTTDPNVIHGKRAYQMDIIGAGEGIFYIKIADGLIAVEPYDYRDHNARFLISSEHLLDLMEKKLAMADALVTGKIHIEGDWDSVMEMNQLLEQLV